MKLIDVPHYSQSGAQDCQAAAAAMVMDFVNNHDDGGNAERIALLLEEFSFGFRPTSGHPPPAITGLVALAIANRGYPVDFFSENPDCSGTDGLGQLEKSPYEFTPYEKKEFCDLAKEKLSNAAKSGLIIHAAGMSEKDIENLIESGRPVVAIIAIKILKEDFPRDDNHAVVITGIDNDSVAINDPAAKTPHDIYPRTLFFEAHNTKATDNDAYVVSRDNQPKNSDNPLSGGNQFVSSDKYECWELDGHILASISGNEYVIDTGSPLTYLANDNLKIGDRVYEGSDAPKNLLKILNRNVSPGVAGLIGLDVLSNYDVHISLGKRVIEFHSEPYALPGSTSLPVVPRADNIPTLEMSRANCESLDAILDTGARFSYLSISDTDNDKQFGSAWDFWPNNPNIDRFPVRLYNVNLTLADYECSFTAGNREDVAGLPDVEIIGSEILRHFDINIALRRNLIELRATR